MKKLIVVSVILITIAFCGGYLRGLRVGEDGGARQMARHILNPDFRTDSFVAVAYEESGRDYDPNEMEKWRQAASSWQYAAEHYGGICKWLLENKPIYGKIIMDTNATLRDCLIVYGSSEAAIDISGTNSLIMNCRFMAMDMDWVVSTTATDPNEFEEIKKWKR